MDLNESPDCILSELVIVYTKSAIVFEKIRRECDVFEVANFVTRNFDLSDPLPCRSSDPHFNNFKVTLTTY